MTTLPPAAYASKRELRNAIRDNAELYEQIQLDYAHELVPIITNTYTAEALTDEVRAWQDKVVNNYADYLWLTQGHNYQASASELRDDAKSDECEEVTQ